MDRKQRRRGPGRPAGSANKAGDGVARVRLVSVRLSEAEVQAIASEAQDRGIARDELVRRVLRRQRWFPTAEDQRR